MRPTFRRHGSTPPVGRFDVSRRTARSGFGSVSSHSRTRKCRGADRGSRGRAHLLDGIQGEVGTAIGEAIRESVALAPRDENGGALQGHGFAVLLLSDGGEHLGGGAQRRRRRGEGLRHSDPRSSAQRRAPWMFRTRSAVQTIEVHRPGDLRQILGGNGWPVLRGADRADLQAGYEADRLPGHLRGRRGVDGGLRGAGRFFLLLGATSQPSGSGRIPVRTIEWRKILGVQASG